jgi:sugar lactone lactonase YvrE
MKKITQLIFSFSLFLLFNPELFSQITFTSSPITTIEKNTTYNYNITTNNDNGDAVTLTAPTIPSWLSLYGGEVSTFAGSTSGFVNGPVNTASFTSVVSAAIDASGNMYVADLNNNVIRKINSDGVVSTFAGSGSFSYADGTGTAASFNTLERIAVDLSGNVYVTDRNNNKIRKITPAGVVTTLAGSSSGSANGSGTAAQFSAPKGIAVDNLGNVYVADTNNHRIRKITPAGAVTTLAGSSYGDNDGTGTAAQFQSPQDVAVDGSGNVYVADTSNSKVKKITPAGVVTTLAGSTAGYLDGTGTAAMFAYPTGIEVDGAGNIYVADNNNYRIRKITPTGVVTTFAGRTITVTDSFMGDYETGGFEDGNAADALFNRPNDITIDASGNLYVADIYNYKIRKISSNSGELVGTAPSVAGSYPVVLNADDNNNGSANQNFTITIVDVNAPIISTLLPLDDATNIIVSQNIELTFNENIFKGTGNIIIKKTSDNSIVETIDVATESVSISTTTATINPEIDLDLNTGYYIQVASTAFKDSSNNNYAGMSSTTALNFTTEANQTNTYLSAGGNWSDPTRWSLNRIPISTDNVETNTNSPDLDLSAVAINNLNINLGGSLNIITGNSLTVNGNLIQSGTFTINSDATTNGSLIIKGTSTGLVIYKRYLTTSAVATEGWHLVGAPVNGQNINVFTTDLLTSGSNNKSIATYDNSIASPLAAPVTRWNYYVNGSVGTNNIASAGAFLTAKGYSIKRENAGALEFTGTLNTNNLGEFISITDAGDEPDGNRWNLISNPYTAALKGGSSTDDTNSFLRINIDASILDPTRAGLYLWNGNSYEEKSIDDDFFIAPGQAFFVHAPDNGGTLVSFTEAMQNHQTGNLFLRSSSNYPEIILTLTNGTSNSLTKVRYLENKTTGLDVGSDVGTFTGTNSSFKVFSHLVSNSEGIDFAIQALPNSNYENMFIPIGVSAQSGKEITFSLNADYFPSDMKIYLEDRVTNTFTRLDEANSSYKIILENTLNGIGRFYMHTTNSSLSVDKEFALENVRIYKLDNHSIRILGLSKESANLSIFNILGKQVVKTSFTANGVHDISLPKLATGVYIVKLQTEKGNMSKKIVLE